MWVCYERDRVQEQRLPGRHPRRLCGRQSTPCWASWGVLGPPPDGCIVWLFPTFQILYNGDRFLSILKIYLSHVNRLWQIYQSLTLAMSSSVADVPYQDDAWGSANWNSLNNNLVSLELITGRRFVPNTAAIPSLLYLVTANLTPPTSGRCDLTISNITFVFNSSKSLAVAFGKVGRNIQHIQYTGWQTRVWQ